MVDSQPEVADTAGAVIPRCGEERMSPLEWPWALASPAMLRSEDAAWQGALVRSWRGTSPLMTQPPLDHHYLVMHLGGPKQVTRRLDGPGLSTVAECGSLTLVPAGTSYVWNTRGPISFAHLYIPPIRLEHVVGELQDGDPAGVMLAEGVGLRDPVAEQVFAALLRELEAGPHASALKLDSLLESLLGTLARKHSTAPFSRRYQPMALAPFRLKRVFEYVDAHIGDRIALADLVAVSGLSASHFSHAFRNAAGESPYRYVVRRRIELAKVLLLSGDDPLDAVSARCGFNSSHQFAVMFKRAVGVGPKRFRLERAPRGRKGRGIAFR